MYGTEPFGGLLRRLRESAGLTQEQLAERAGLTPKAVSLLERGERTRPYPHTVTALADALGLAPEQRADLLASVRRTGPHPAPAWPRPPTPLVGRDHDLRDLEALVNDPATRLVTLTGTGGVGKTRLALGVLDQVAPRFPGGGAFVPLAPVAAPDLVLPSVVRGLGLTEAGREPREVLRAYLGQRRMLLVLDNFEHLVDAATDVAWLLESSESLVVLVTSRGPLHLRAEVEHPVPPLWSPETGSPSVEAVLGSPAGRLFTDRARAVSTGFEVTEENAADVAAICRSLAGLPLALEIVAARTRFVGTAQLLSRLDRALQDEGARDLPERHRTLRRTLDWSHDLLGEADRAVFARPSVFAGGFTLEAAEAVAQGDALASLEHLVGQSLVLVEPAGTGSVRYRLLEPVRQYAAEKLADRGETEPTRSAHAEHYVALAERAYPRIERAEQIEWLDRLSVENDNLRAAIAWAVATGRTELAARLGWSLRMYWLMRDRRREGLLLMEEASRHAGVASELVRAQLLHVRAFCLYGYQGPQRALAEEGLRAFCLYGYQGPQRALAEEGLRAFRQVGDSVGEEYSLGMLGFALLVEGALDDAAVVLAQALEMSDRRGDDSNAAHLLNHLAVVPLRRGDMTAAAGFAERALERARRTGERLAQQTAHQVLAQTAWARGDRPAALRRFQDSLRVALELSDTVNVAYSLRGVAVCDVARGWSDDAARMLGAAERTLEEAGSPVFAWTGELDLAVAEAVRAGSRDQAWLTAYAEGRSAGLEEAVAAALGR